jgi:phosphate transport system permease protein
MKKTALTRRRSDRVSRIVFLVLSSISVIVLFTLLGSILLMGLPHFDLDFIISLPSRFADKSGILAALVGSIYLVILTLVIALPIGIGTAIYLQEFGKNKKIIASIQVLILNLAGVPSIVYGIFGLAIFVRTFGFGKSILAGAFTMAMLVLPLLIVSTQEALKTVPKSLKEASLALGTSHLQTTLKITFAYAFPNILTGIILAVARILGETAPLLMVGAYAYVNFLPTSVSDSFSALPVQIYSWTSKPQEEFKQIAATAIIVLLILQLSLNGVAILVRSKMQRRYEE